MTLTKQEENAQVVDALPAEQALLFSALREVCGYDPATDLVTCWNSWGSGWGKSGKFFFTSKTWAKLLAAQGDVTVPLAVQL